MLKSKIFINSGRGVDQENELNKFLAKINNEHQLKHIQMTEQGHIFVVWNGEDDKIDL